MSTDIQVIYADKADDINLWWTNEIQRRTTGLTLLQELNAKLKTFPLFPQVFDIKNFVNDSKAIKSITITMIFDHLTTGSKRELDAFSLIKLTLCLYAEFNGSWSIRGI